MILATLLFYVAGYRWVFSYLENRTTAKLEQRIEAGTFTDEQLVEIKIPLNMPYYSDKGYESVYGETEWNGQHYRYVKRKVSGNTLYLLCIKNTDKSKIIEEKNNFTKAAGDAQQSNVPSKQIPAPVKLLFSEYFFHENSTPESAQQFSSIKRYLTDTNLYSQFDPQTASQPPELIG